MLSAEAPSYAKKGKHIKNLQKNPNPTPVPVRKIE